jgi:flagellar biosynthesis protein FlhG
MFLGLGSVKKGIGTFLSQPKAKFEEIVIDTDYNGMRFVAGDAEIPGLANLQSSQKKRVIRRLLALDADFLVLDLGAGTGNNTLDFFLISGTGLIVTTPTLTATLNAYLFLKNAVFRVMSSSFKRGTQAYEFLQDLRKQSASLQKLYIPQLLSKIRELDPESHIHFSERISRFRPRLIMNLLEDPRDSVKAGKLKRSCHEYLGIELEHLGIIYRDDMQNVALSSRLPIVRYKPNCILSQGIYRIADKLVQMEEQEGSPLDYQSVEATYQEAEMEAEIDFNSKLEYLEELLHSGALSMGELAETIKSQQFEISQLKKENQLLKTKLVRAVREGYAL